MDYCEPHAASMTAAVGSKRHPHKKENREHAPGHAEIAKNSKTIADLSKRKSFADMQFAEVASGGQPLNFEELDMLEESDGEDEDKSAVACNGFQKEPETKSDDKDILKNGGAGEEAGVGAGGGDNTDMAAVDGMPGDPAIPAKLPSVAEHKTDPVFEIATDLKVKIADLGNACWVVSARH